MAKNTNATGKSNLRRPANTTPTSLGLAEQGQQLAARLINAPNPGKTLSHDPHGSHVAEQQFLHDQGAQRK